MTTSQKKLDSKQVENPSSGKGDGETKRFFSPTRRASEIISGVEKLEGQVADQEKRWGAFVSLRGRWDEATRIQRTIVASTQELGNTQKEAETLRQVLEKLKGKDREQQREVLASQKEFLQKYGDMQALVQKPETKFQKKWFAEQSERMERYKVAREFLSQEKREFVETTVHTFDLFGAKIDIDGFYHSLSSYEINIRERRDLVKNGDKARYLLNLYEKEEKSYESQDERPITEQRFTLKEDVLLSMATNYPDLYNIKMRDTKDHGTVFWLNRAINSENRSRKDKKQYIVDLKGRVDQTHGDAKPQLQDLCKIGEGINEHVSQQKDLRSSVRMLEKVIADTEYYQNGDRERIEEDYKEFIKNYGISREEVKGNKSKETMEKQLCGFKEAHDLYQALIDGKKNNVSNEDMKVNMDDKINKAKIRKEAVKCYLLAIEKEDRGPMHEYMMRMEKEKMKEVMNVYEFKNIISLFKLLKEEKSCYAKIQELRPSYQKEAAESTQRTEAAEREIYSKQPGAKEGYQKLVMDLAKDWCQDFKKLVRSDLLFEKIIDLCESWQNEFSNALEKLVSQEEERVASKQGEIEDLQISLQGLRVESSNDMNTFIQENRRNLAKADMAQETESQVKQRGIEGWLEQG
ncbi:MAG TPA: hypothetical protein VK553_06665, partial [Candidatus Nitrosopolaris rasttigaisensis]|nr:hypothetical protein [Candidatus Nitrosopolaris rasttigaisensis]